MAKATKANRVRLEDLGPAELRTYRLYGASGRPLPAYLRYMGGVWHAFIPQDGLRALGVELKGALSIMVTAWTAREAADALWHLLNRLGLKIERPELAEPGP